MEEEKIGFFSQVAGSIARIETYRYFFKRTTGKAILYLLLLSLIFGTAGALRVMYEVNTGISQFISYFQFEVPEFSLENGELKVEADMPMIISQTQEHLFMIDTTGNTDERVLEPYPNGLLITKHEFIQKENYGMRKQSFQALQGIVLTKSDVVGFFPYLRFINIFVVIFGFIFHFIGKLISALWVAIAGVIISSSVKYKLPFGTHYKLSIYALTLPIILKAMFRILGVAVPFFGWIYYGIAIFYLWKAINMLKEYRPGEEPGTDLY
jgi:hypothetical protein